MSRSIRLAEELSARAARAGALFLCVRRLLGRGDRAQDELPLLAQRRPRAKAATSSACAAATTARRSARWASTNVDLVPRRLRSAADASHDVTSPDATPDRPESRGRGTPRRRDDGAPVRRRAEQIAALIVEPLVQCAGGMAHARPVLPARAARAVRPLRGAPDRRRDRVSASAVPAPSSPASRPASGPISCACPRASPAATCRCRSCSRARTSTRPSTPKRGTRLPAFAQLHRQSAGLPRGPGDAGHLRVPTVLQANRRARRAPGALLRPLHEDAHVADVRRCGMIWAFDVHPMRCTAQPAAAMPSPSRGATSPRRARRARCCARSAIPST